MVWLDLPFLPTLWQGMFQAFGNVIFQTKALPGLLVFLGLAFTSPLTTLVAATAYTSGVAIMVQLGVAAESVGYSIGGYNFVLCGISLGAAYFIPSGASLLLASFGCVVCAFTGVALGAALQYLLVASQCFALQFGLVDPRVRVAAARQCRSAGAVARARFDARGSFPASLAAIAAVSRSAQAGVESAV